MRFIPLSEASDELWYKSYLTTYNQDLGFHMGVEPSLLVNPPTLTQFYDNITAAYEAGKFRAWAIVDKDDTYLGQTLLDKSSTGEWEVGTVLADKTKWNSGVGVRATLHALAHAFKEEEAEWVVAFTQGRDPKVREMLIRGGFRGLMKFLIMDRRTYFERWGKEQA